jgi:hypothetical protein
MTSSLQRRCFGFFEKISFGFFNHACGMTEPKEAPYAGTGVSARMSSPYINK